MHDRRLEALRRALAAHRPRTVGSSLAVARASVALVLRPEPTDLEVLLIRRATVPGDPWSGHMALPGGRRAEQDASGRDTAVRETLEEVGVDLWAHGSVLGRLDDVQPRAGAPRIAVSAYVFAVPSGTGTSLNHEVERAFWVPLSHLAAPGAATEYLHALTSGETLRFPAIGYQEYVIWGITYRILTQFLELARNVSG